MSSARRVPPGSRVTSTDFPSARSASASAATCVDFPPPSGPSKLMNFPRMAYSMFATARAA